ncbi:hypothetical protein [Rossellomorea vietnamensis]|uniref:hypothetical protein n=1 Tax=Rossellomorea vietnamensis TaxID=218284 RepID=UPI00055748DD|nr:hypothetical protein [Rossellomorea vietnamensis]
MRKGNKRKIDYLYSLLKLKWVFMGIVLYFYGFMLKNEIFGSATELKLSFNNWDITLRLMNDLYLIVFFIVPLVVFNSIKSTLVDFDYQVLVRLGSYKRWVYHSLIQFWFRSFPVLLVWCFMSFFLTIGFPYESTWSGIGKSDYVTNTLHVLVNLYEAPLLAFIAQVILLILSFSLLHLFISIFYVVTRNKNLVFAVCAFVFISTIIGFKLLPKELSFLSPATYFSLTKAANTFNVAIIEHLVVVVLLLIIILYLQVIDINNKNFKKLIIPYTPFIIYFILCVTAIFTSAYSLKAFPEASVGDIAVKALQGTSSENFMYLSFFNYSIIYFGFLYFVQVFLSNEVGDLGYYKIIRYQSLFMWFWSWLKNLLLMNLVFLISIVLISFLSALLFDISISLNVSLLKSPLYQIIYHFLVNGFFQLCFYTLVAFILAWINKESIYGVLLIGILMVLMLPGFNVMKVLPVGLNGFAYLANSSPFYITIILLVMNVIAILIINILFRKSTVI